MMKWLKGFDLIRSVRGVQPLADSATVSRLGAGSAGSAPLSTRVPSPASLYDVSPPHETHATPPRRVPPPVPLGMKRLRSKAAALVRKERETLLIGLHAELDSERARFEARKPAISEEVR